MAARKPNIDVNWLVQQTLKAIELAKKHKDKVEPRLPTGLLDGLQADVSALNAKTAAPETALIGTKAATVKQNTALAEAYALISAIGMGVKRKSGTTAEARRAYGVGSKTKSNVVRSVVARGNAILARAEAQPEEARSLGILDSDLSALREKIVALEAADEDQELLIARKPLTTRERNAAMKRIYQGLKDVAAAGVLGHALEPAIRDQFDRLDDLPKRRS